MAIDTNVLAEKIFNILKGFGYAVKNYDKQGKLVVNPQEATRFSVADPNLLVRLDLNYDLISLATSEDLSEHPIRKMLQKLARSNPPFTFDYKIFDKKIEPKGEAVNIAQNSEKDMADVMEGFGVMTGSTKTSYQPLDNIKIVVRHKKAVNEEVRGSRSRNIHSIYIQRGEEKFKMAENSLKAARAMARHLYAGGEMHDSVGESITQLAAEYRKLQEFVRYVRKANLVNESNEEYVTLALEQINSIRNTFEKLSGIKTYANTVESLEDYQNLSIIEEDTIEIEQKFVETHFDNRVADAMGGIKRAMAKQQAYESRIKNAIQEETFEGLKDSLRESDVIDFESPQARLGHQVAQMGYAAQNPILSNHLHGISKKLNAGGTLNQFEYGTVKSCLLSASEAKIKTIPSITESEQYEKYLETFVI